MVPFRRRKLLGTKLYLTGAHLSMIALGQCLVGKHPAKASTAELLFMKICDGILLVGG